MFAVEGVGVPPIAVSPDVSLSLGGATFHHDDLIALSYTPPSIPFMAPNGAALAAFHREPGGDVLYAVEGAMGLPGLLIEPNDVVRYSAGVDSLELDGSAFGLPDGVRIDAVSVHGSGDLLISFDTTVDLDGAPGGAVAEDEDLVRVTGTSLSLFFDGTSQGVDPALDLDAAHYDPADGTLLLSFDGSGLLGGNAFDDEDVLYYDAGTWLLALDASVQFPELEPADVQAVPEPGALPMLLPGVCLLQSLVRRRRRREARGARPDPG